MNISNFGKVVIHDISDSMCIIECNTFSSKANAMKLPVSAHRVHDFLSGKDDRLVQDAFPDLDANYREFLLTGLTGEEFDSLTEEE